MKQTEAEERTKGGIVLPDTAKEKPQQGKVVAAGKGKREGRRQACSRSTSRPATRSSSASTRGRTSKIDGEEYLIMREDEVLAVLEAAQ